jgi:hypothetical protein
MEIKDYKQLLRYRKYHLLLTVHCKAASDKHNGEGRRIAYEHRVEVVYELVYCGVTQMNSVTW